MEEIVSTTEEPETLQEQYGLFKLARQASI